MSEPADLIYSKMAAVMAEVQAVEKKDRNDHQKFHFRGIDAVVNAVGPALRKHGVVVVPHHVDATYRDVKTSTGKPATACQVSATYMFYASDGSFMSANVAGEAWDAGDKATPKAMSVAFRTALLQALTLPTDEPDPDATSYEKAVEVDMSGFDKLVVKARAAGVEKTDSKWAELRSWAVQSESNRDRAMGTVTKAVKEAGNVDAA